MLFALIIIGILALYLIIDIARLFKSRINREFLRHAWIKTAIWLVSFQVIVVLVAFATSLLNINLIWGLYIAAVIQFIVSAVILISVRDNLSRAKSPNLTHDIASKDLPTITVCIPARNETLDLQECLESLIASTYPKLEILVLDDSSQDRRTPEIIRGFAHDGVRFIAGEAPPESWLAKNFAYKQLAKEANGDLLLFCGVDSRFSPETITNLVLLQIKARQSMLSIMPRNYLKGGTKLGQNYIQPSRYAWEIALPRQFTNRPPVLSTCWIITKDRLESLGKFDAVSHKSMPESYFAQNLSRVNEYQFVISNENIGLESRKSIAEQKATAIRTRYPQLHRRPELVALVSMALIAQMIWPFFICIFSAVFGLHLLAIISGGAIFLNVFGFSRIVDITYRRRIVSGIFSLPLAAIYDVYLLNYSMWQYEFGEVIWKDRNISTPIMQVSTELPKI